MQVKNVLLVTFLYFPSDIFLCFVVRVAKAIVKFKKELSPYAGAKGTVRFPLDEPIPFDLIGRIAKSRVQDNVAKAKGKKKT